VTGLPEAAGRVDGDTGFSVERLARAWSRAITGTSFVTMSRADLRFYLEVLARDLIDALTAEVFDRAVPDRVGRALVAAHFTEVGSVERTLALLGRELAGAATGPDGAARLAGVLGAVAAGYAHALQDRTRAEQEQITTSTFMARAAAEQARWNSEARFQAVFDEAVVGIGVSDTEGTILDVNRALAAMFGRTPDDMVGTSMWRLVHPDDGPDFWDELTRLTTGEIEHVRRRKAFYRDDGTEFWTDQVVSLVRDPTGAPRYLVGMVEDITEQYRLEARLRHQAEHDPLTGLPNRTLFFERLDAALRAGAVPGVCYLDLDGFKAINDTLGHGKGDALLRETAARLDAAFDGEHLVCHLGGDEFVVLIEHDPDDEHLARVARTALAVVAEPVPLRGNDIAITVTASAGVVRADADGPADGGAAAVMAAADTTLSWAKTDGRNRYALFDEQRHRDDLDRFALSARMPEALAAGEFSLEYQPLVRLTDRRVVGVEALLRWTLPDGRRVGAERLVPLAEDTGFIVPLGRWVLEQACRQAAAWAAARAGDDPADRLFVSVNVAARQVREPGLVEDVAAVLAATGWPPELLQLELTESALMGTPDGSLAVLHALADMGVRIAIDDFGTGYSNLAYLRHLPVQVLKMAGPFVTGVGPDDGTGDGAGPQPAAGAADREVVGLIVRLAHRLGLTVTAESVETSAQLAALEGLGCDIGQGWLFAPAVPAHEVPALAARPLGPRRAG
jgi:diguanylate cyclase (GGDEF)-like protein/PAS domain S-box-containing protein